MINKVHNVSSRQDNFVCEEVAIDASLVYLREHRDLIKRFNGLDANEKIDIL